MEAQLAAARGAELRADVAELTRAERATVHLVDRVRSAVGGPVTLRLAAGEPVRGVVLDAAPQWVLLDAGGVRRALVPTGAVVAVGGLPAHAAPPAGTVERRLGLGHALRALARDRVVVRVRLASGDVAGRVERVGADHVDLVEDGARAAVRTCWSVPFAAVLVVASG
ncbi:hypothetical protein HLB10_15645 [Cellulomonas fimi]|nr:hypothetical protein [Cellulomonas fimi]